MKNQSDPPIKELTDLNEQQATEAQAWLQAMIEAKWREVMERNKEELEALEELK